MNKKYNIIIILLLIISVLMNNCFKQKTAKNKIKKTDKVSKSKILYVDSYHAEFDWIKLITRGILKELNIKVDKNGNLDNSESTVELKIIHMDTKRNKSEIFKKEASKKAKKIIDEWNPDVVIASDDNASKYLIVPYYKNSEIPFIFCGINWDTSAYGYPFDNVTGMVEVMLVDQLVETLKEYSKGSRIGILTVDTLTERKNIKNIKDHYNLDLISHYVNSMEDFKIIYKKTQKECDILLLTEMQSLKNYDKEQLINFINNNTIIPTGTMFDFMSPFVLISYAATGEEHGEWSAKTALEIINGKSPKEIPIVTNKKAKIFLNMTLADKLDIKFPMELIEQSTFIVEAEF